MWKTFKLKEICSVFTDGDWIETKDQSAEGIRLVQTGNVKIGKFADRRDKARYISKATFKRLNCTEVMEGDILVSRLPEPVGRACVIPELQEKAITAVDCTVIRTNDNVSPRYLNYYMQSPQYFSLVQEKVTGATRQRISRKNLGEVLVSLPPLAEQQRIVAKLDAAFAEIDEAIENLKTNEMNLKKLIDSTLERFFNNEIYDEYELNEVCTFVGGSQPPKSEFEYEESENNIRLIQIRDYKSDKHIVYIPKDKARRFCTKDDVMIGRYGPPIFQILRGIEGSYNVALMKAIPKENILNDYLFYFLKNRRIQNFVINKSSRAAGQSGVNKDTLEPYIINLPSIETQKEICEASKELELQAICLSNVYKKKLDNLMSLKSAILAQKLKLNEAA